VGTKLATRLTDKEVLHILALAVKRAGGQRDFAASYSVSQSHLSRALAGKERPSKAMLAAIGLTRDPHWYVKD
jgi:DNA-binding phage protein